MECCELWLTYVLNWYFILQLFVRIGKFEFTDAGKFEEVSERLWTRFVREGIRKNS